MMQKSAAVAEAVVIARVQTVAITMMRNAVVARVMTAVKPKAQAIKKAVVIMIPAVVIKTTQSFRLSVSL